MKIKIQLATISLAVLLIVVLAMWSSRTLEFWLGYYKGAPVVTPWWLDTLVVFTGPLNFLANILSEVARLAI